MQGSETAVTVGPGAASGAESMRAYYAQRAASYERVYHKPERQADLRALEAWMAEAFRGRRVLEIAAGTGWWTGHGARHAAAWLATDVNAEPLAIARSRPTPAVVRFALRDAYALQDLPGETFDAAFAGFWWSHVPRACLPGWLARLHACLQPGARVVFLDNRFVAGSSTPLARRDAEGNTYQLRTLDDHSRHEVLKNFPTRAEALAAIGTDTADVQWIEFTHYWVLAYTLAGRNP